MKIFALSVTILLGCLSFAHAADFAADFEALAVKSKADGAACNASSVDIELAVGKNKRSVAFPDRATTLKVLKLYAAIPPIPSSTLQAIRKALDHPTERAANASVRKLAGCNLFQAIDVERALLLSADKFKFTPAEWSALKQAIVRFAKQLAASPGTLFQSLVAATAAEEALRVPALKFPFALNAPVVQLSKDLSDLQKQMRERLKKLNPKTDDGDYATFLWELQQTNAIRLKYKAAVFDKL